MNAGILHVRLPRSAQNPYIFVCVRVVGCNTKRFGGRDLTRVLGTCVCFLFT